MVANNEISYIGGDAILTIGVEDCYIEHNQALQTALLGRAGTACAAIWPINCRRVCFPNDIIKSLGNIYKVTLRMAIIR